MGGLNRDLLHTLGVASLLSWVPTLIGEITSSLVRHYIFMFLVMVILVDRFKQILDKRKKERGLNRGLWNSISVEI